MKFCGECGTRFAVLCRQCGARNAPAQKFCGECGARLESGASSRQLPTPDADAPKHLADKILTFKMALEGERKQFWLTGVTRPLAHTPTLAECEMIWNLH